MADIRTKKCRIGEENINNQGLKMKIIRYRMNKDIDVEFEDGWIARNKEYKNFKNKNIRNPYFPEVYGVGYIGEGKYPMSVKGKNTKIYDFWNNMFKRCYNDKIHEKFSTYKDCTVCEEWYNFQNFAEWYEENYYEVKGDTMCIDKDILLKGNKIYSSETCIFVPQRINKLFTKNNKNRGDYLIGVSKISNPNSLKQYQATLTCLNKTKCFKTEIEAFNWYKEEKEKLIKEVADEYKDKIPEKLYEAMINWKVEIND